MNDPIEPAARRARLRAAAAKVPSSEPSAPAGPQPPDALLLEAKRSGLDDRRAAQYAGLTLAELRQRLKRDPTLRRQLRQAHAQGLGDHLQNIRGAPQWQAQKYLLEKLWVAEFGVARSRRGRKPNPMFSSFKEVAARMTEDQIARAAELLEMGRQADNQRKAAEGADALCAPTAPHPSPVSPPAASAAPASTPPSATFADSSASPGPSSSRARRS